MSKASQLASLDNGMLVQGTLRNLRINGGLQIWQRGTSLPSSFDLRYCAGRFAIASGNSSYSTTREAFATGEAMVPSGIKYFQRIVVVTGAISTPHTIYLHRIEGLMRKTTAVAFSSPGYQNCSALSAEANDTDVRITALVGTAGHYDFSAQIALNAEL